MPQIQIPCVGDTFIARGSYSDPTFSEYDNYGAEKSVSHFQGFTYPVQIHGIFQYDLDNRIKNKKINKATLYIPVQTPTDGEIYWYSPNFNEIVEQKITYSNCTDNLKFNGYYVGAGMYARIADGNYVTRDITFVVNGKKKEKYISISIAHMMGVGDIYFRESGKLSYILIDYEDIVPLQPEISSPINVYFTQDDIVTFLWKYNSNDGGMQEKVEIQWRKAGSEEWNTIAVNNIANEKTEVSGNIFPVGKIQWRIRTYNEDGNVSPYSEIAEFTIMGKPSIPIMGDIENDSRPVITWTSSEQDEFEVQIMSINEEIIEETGMLPGFDIRTYRMKSFLANGSYIARVRIRNTYGYVSDWGYRSFTVSYESGNPAEIYLNGSEGKVVINIKGASGTAYVIKRLNEKESIIGIAKNGIFVDYAVISGQEYSYKIRDYYGGYTDSRWKNIKVEYEGIIIRSTKEPRKMLHGFLKEQDEALLEGSVNCNAYSVYYVGRKYPVAECDGTLSEDYGINFVIKPEEYSVLKEILLAQEVVLICDKDDVFYGMITKLTRRRILSGTKVEVNLSVMKIDYDEDVLEND